MDSDPSVNMLVTISNKPKVFPPSICMLVLCNINEIIFSIYTGYGCWMLLDHFQQCFSFYCGGQLYWSLKNTLAYPKSQTNYHLKLGVSMHIIINFCKNYKNEKCRSQQTNKTNKKTYCSHMFSTILVRIGSIEEQIWYNSPWLLTSSLATSMLVPSQMLWFTKIWLGWAWRPCHHPCDSLYIRDNMH